MFHRFARALNPAWDDGRLAARVPTVNLDALGVRERLDAALNRVASDAADWRAGYAGIPLIIEAIVL